MTRDDNNDIDLVDDDDRKPFPYRGATLDRGRILLEEHIRGRLWKAKTDQHSILLVHKQSPYDKYRTMLDSLFRFDTPGIAALEFLGFPDDGGPEVALAEALPEGRPISELPPLSAVEVTRCGVGLCETVLAWAERCESLVAGLRPETVYVTPKGYAGATPRIGLFASDPYETTFGGDRYAAPTESMLDLGIDEMGFVLAQILWFALLHEHPYKLPDAPDERENIWHDRRRAFTGTPELGRILEAVLVADPDRRLGVQGFRDQLSALAKAG